jgi:hypothetical protein
MKKAIIGSVALLAYVNIIPYACREWRGIDWVPEYLPDEGHLISGLLLIGGVASLAAIPLIVTFLLRKKIPITFVVSIIIATAVLSSWHYNDSRAASTNAVIGLFCIPIYAAAITGVAAVIIGLIEYLSRRKERSPTTDCSLPTEGPASVENRIEALEARNVMTITVTIARVLVACDMIALLYILAFLGWEGPPSLIELVPTWLTFALLACPTSLIAKSRKAEVAVVLWFFGLLGAMLFLGPHSSLLQVAVIAGLLAKPALIVLTELKRRRGA